MKKFGEGKKRICCGLFQSTKDGSYWKWKKGKWINVTEAINDIIEIEKEIDQMTSENYT